MGFPVREIVRLAVGLVLDATTVAPNARRQSFGLQLDISTQRETQTGNSQCWL